MATVQGLFYPKNPSKYDGDPNKIVYRSSWERSLFIWVDENPDIVKWQSEEFFIPYRCRTDGKMHRYFPDAKLQFKSGKVALIEIKPYIQVQKPKASKGKQKRTYLMECFTYSKNTSKWDAAEEYCKRNGWVFQIWTEHTLKSLGIRIEAKK